MDILLKILKKYFNNRKRRNIDHWGLYLMIIQRKNIVFKNIKKNDVFEKSQKNSVFEKP